MRELAKSILSFSWSMPFFGAKQMMSMAAPRDMSRPFGQAAAGFDAVTAAAKSQLGGMLQGTFQAGDQLQGGLVDAAFNLLPLEAMSPAGMMRTASRLMQRSIQALGQVRRGS
jgi:hypothetical protein